MDKNKVFILLEDDTEILGNGAGHVMYRMYLPVRRYIDILKLYNAKSTFYVDMAHWLFLRENSEIKDFALQADLIEKTILHILKNKMEVQLHLHSQWANAKIENGNIYVTEKWNIGQLKEKDQRKLFSEGFKYLQKIISKSSNQNVLNSFKAGSWGLQPFEILYEEFKNAGIKIVMGPSKGLKLSALELDYSTMESEITPYYCCKSDINKISAKEEIVVVPMTPTYLNWIDLIRYIFHVKFKSFIDKFDEDLDVFNLPEEIKSLNPVSNRDRINSLFMPYKTNLKMNKQPYWYLKKTFNRAYKSVIKNDFGYKLIVMETHTKDFKNTFNDIEKFFKFLTTNYKNIEFITASDLERHIADGRMAPLSNKNEG